MFRKHGTILFLFVFLMIEVIYMRITVNLPDYDGNGLDVIWEDESNYILDVNEHDIIISANKHGLISLAKQMLYMAYNDLPTGSHVHYDEFFTKMPTSNYELIIQKTEDDSVS